MICRGKFETLMLHSIATNNTKTVLYHFLLRMLLLTKYYNISAVDQTLGRHRGRAAPSLPHFVQTWGKRLSIITPSRADVTIRAKKIRFLLVL